MSIRSRINDWLWGVYDLRNDNELDIVFTLVNGEHVVFTMPDDLTQKGKVQIVADIMDAMTAKEPTPPLQNGLGQFVSVVPEQIATVTFNGPWIGEEAEPEPTPEVQAAVQDQFQRIAQKMFGDRLYDGPLDENGAPTMGVDDLSGIQQGLMQRLVQEQDGPEEEFARQAEQRNIEERYVVRVEPQPGLSPDERARVEAEIAKTEMLGGDEFIEHYGKPRTAEQLGFASNSDDPQLSDDAARWENDEREIDRREGSR